MLPAAAHDGRTQAKRCAMNGQVEEAGDRGVRFCPRGRMPQATFVMFIGTLCCNPRCPYTCRNKL